MNNSQFQLKEINNLKNNISNAHKSTYATLGNNIFRSHLRSLSTDIENEITIFISKLLKENYKFFIDSSVYIKGKENRPDLLIVNNKNEVVALIEIKAQMGHCRDARIIVDKLLELNNKFKQQKVITCKFSHFEPQDVIYGNNVILFLVSLTKDNCSPKQHQQNKDYTKEKGVAHFNLFSGWYENLENYEVEDFVKAITNL